VETSFVKKEALFVATGYAAYFTKSKKMWFMWKLQVYRAVPESTALTKPEPIPRPTRAHRGPVNDRPQKTLLGLLFSGPQ